jgi:hypothetical protein
MPIIDNGFMNSVSNIQKHIANTPKNGFLL